MTTKTAVKKQLFINNQWREAVDYQALTSPYSNKTIAHVPVANEAEVDAAIESAYGAVDKMADMPAHERAAILERLAALLEARADEAAEMIANEAAKPITAAQDEVKRTIQTYKFAAEEAKRIYGETFPLDAAPNGENRLAYTVHEPIGVIGAITPFNFPMNLVAHKVGPAIATGNPIVLKPASQTPLSAFFLAELLLEAGLPAGALNVVSGSGQLIGEKLVTDSRINAITFTGSPAVGIGIRNNAGLKRVTLELGSNAAVIIDEDVDLDKTVSRCVTGAYSNQGQVCISLQRVYIHENVYEAFVEKFVEATKQVQIGDPLDPKTVVSALISKGDVNRALDWIEEAKQNGSEVAAGGTSTGNIVHPTVLLNTHPSMKVSCQEVFAPIVILNKCKSVGEAIEQVNDSKYGLQAGIYTNNVHTALEAAEKLHVGGVMINDIPTFRVDHMPYGGVKESGSGREGIKYAMQDMLEKKLVVFNRN